MNGFTYFRQKGQLTQKEVAEILGVEQSTISKWENDRKLPRSHRLPFLAALYGCQIEDLFKEFD